MDLVEVSVICSFDTTGKVMPIFIRLGSNPYKIERCIEAARAPYERKLSLYHCSVIDGNVRKDLDLYFDKDKYVWQISRDIARQIEYYER